MNNTATLTNFRATFQADSGPFCQTIQAHSLEEAHELCNQLLDGDLAGHMCLSLTEIAPGSIMTGEASPKVQAAGFRFEALATCNHTNPVSTLGLGRNIKAAVRDAQTQLQEACLDHA